MWLSSSQLAACKRRFSWTLQPLSLIQWPCTRCLVATISYSHYVHTFIVFLIMAPNSHSSAVCACANENSSHKGMLIRTVSGLGTDSPTAVDSAPIVFLHLLRLCQQEVQVRGTGHMLYGLVVGVPTRLQEKALMETPRWKSAIWLFCHGWTNARTDARSPHSSL